MPRAECLPLSLIPHTSQIFRDYSTDFDRVRQWYCTNDSNALGDPQAQANYDANEYPDARRFAVADILAAQNTRWGASAATLANIERLRNGAPAVVTGQQVILFGGPLLTILKAVTAIKHSRARGAVPVFWLATEDHDLAEVRSAHILDAKLALHTFSSDADAPHPDSPVADVVLPSGIADEVAAACELHGETEIADFLRDAYKPGVTFGDAFACLFARIFAEDGLILLDPSDAAFHRVAAPVFEHAISHAADLNSALMVRNKELEAAGYETQVNVTRASSLMFLMEDGSRRVVQRANGHFTLGHRRIEAAELLAIAQSHSERLSANVLLRPAVQDFLLPTLAYIGGPAELAYFAQTDVVYRAILGRAAPVLPRISATIVEPKMAKRLERYSLAVSDTFAPLEDFRRLVAARALPPTLNDDFERAQYQLGEVLTSLASSLEQLDPTLVEASQRAASKISYQLTRLQARAANARARRSEETTRHVSELSAALYPHGGLQERHVAGISFLARNGLSLIRELESTLLPDCAGHQLLWL